MTEIKLTLEGESTPKWLADNLRARGEYMQSLGAGDTAAYLVAVADQIEAQSPKAPVEEPTEFGSVVAASVAGRPAPVKWHMSPMNGKHYWESEFAAVERWSELRDPEVLRVGIGGEYSPSLQQIRDLLFRSPSGSLTPEEIATAYKGLRKGLSVLLSAEPAPSPAEELAHSTLKLAEIRMFGTVDGDLLSDESELPVGELRRLLWTADAEDITPWEIDGGLAAASPAEPSAAKLAAVEAVCAKYEPMVARNEDVKFGANVVLKAIREVLATPPAEAVEADKARQVLAVLVELHDGPRDDHYRSRKPLAWQAARDALAEPSPVQVEAEPVAALEGDQCAACIDDGLACSVHPAPAEDDPIEAQREPDDEDRAELADLLGAGVVRKLLADDPIEALVQEKPSCPTCGQTAPNARYFRPSCLDGWHQRVADMGPWPIGTYATIKVTDGASRAWPVVERVNGGWQSGAHHYPDSTVEAARVLEVGGQQPAWQADVLAEGRPVEAALAFQLCDPDGIVRSGAMHHGTDYTCTGSAHYGVWIACTSPTHQEPLVVGQQPGVPAVPSFGELKTLIDEFAQDIKDVGGEWSDSEASAQIRKFLVIARPLTQDQPGVPVEAVRALAQYWRASDRKTYVLDSSNRAAKQSFDSAADQIEALIPEEPTS